MVLVVWKMVPEGADPTTEGVEEARHPHKLRHGPPSAFPILILGITPIGH